MQWRETVVHTNTPGGDVVSELMMRLGAAGTELVDRADVPDPGKPGAYWELYDPAMLAAMPEDVLVKGWFAQDEKLAATLETLRLELDGLRARGDAWGALTLDMADVADEDWAETWKQYYKPFRIGARLVVKPSWEAYEAQAGDAVVELDPGMAFGTGTHETTFMCMELLERFLRPGDQVMDVGTGSGILAIAAARLGAERVLAVDIDPDAVRVAGENIVKNGVQDRVRAVRGDLVNGETLPCDLAVANIVADAICMLAGPLTRHVKPGGLFVCSGIIREREADVQAATAEAGYAPVARETRGEWVALCLRSGGARA